MDAHGLVFENNFPGANWQVVTQTQLILEVDRSVSWIGQANASRPATREMGALDLLWTRLRRGHEGRPSRERLAGTNGATVQITRSAWFPLGRLADFSYV